MLKDSLISHQLVGQLLLDIPITSEPIHHGLFCLKSEALTNLISIIMIECGYIYGDSNYYNMDIYKKFRFQFGSD